MGELKMSETLEVRLAKVERDLAILKARTLANEPKGDWLESFVGIFADDSDFDEIVRLGKEFRNEDRPKDVE